MRSIKSRWFAAISVSLALLPAVQLCATKRPRYGGTLRVELRTPVISLDPREWKAGSVSAADDEKLASLVYDRLLTLDDYGRVQPSIASEWSHDASFRNWQFKLRLGVKFSDGWPLSATDVVSSLQPLLPSSYQVSANESGLSIRSSHPSPDLLEQLASGPYFVFRAQPDGTLLGTGPFYVAESQPAAPYESNPSATKPARIKFQASEEAWAGRPFVDAVEVTLGGPALRELLDLQTGRADIVEIAPDLVHRAHQESLRVWSSAPNTLLALRFDDAQPAGADDHLREAFSLSLDRATMANVLLQKQAEPTAALLPQWLTGYAFLFDGKMNLERAKQMRAALPANEAVAAEPLRLRVDGAGDLMKLLGERVAVNARQANLAVQVVTRPTNSSIAGGMTGNTAANLAGGGTPLAGLHLFAWHYETVCPRAELDSLAKHLLLQQSAEGAQGVNELETLYAQERRLVEDHRVLPLVLLPEYAGIGSNVRNWMPARWGEWRLADIWLENEDEKNALPAKSSHASPSSERILGRQP
jgi:peptide/nickel transport system substrate-binding protein